jgi:tetratricopeptide (TPR) repeat protein
MPTKLSRYCLGVMEAAWLAAVSVVPIFFNVYSSRIFEPDKITILRSLAILTLAAWVVKLVDEGGIKWKSETNDTSIIKYLWRYPLIAPVVGLVIVYSISTIFSVTPSISFFGSYQRLQGTYTTFSYLVIFLSILANLRKREQINRLITTVIIASLPISLYGLLQRYQIDPVPWGGNVSIRIAANMGNSIFVAAYLIMVVPLTLGRILDAFKDILSDNGNDPAVHGSSSKKIVRATIYVFIAALELIAIYMSGSRGPLLGLLAAVYLMVLLFSIYWRRRWLTMASIALAVLGAGFLAVFNMNTGPLEALKTSPAIGRFGSLLNPESNSALVRQYIWEGTVKLVSIHAPLKFPDGTTDKFNILRPLFGYGPETMYVAFNQFYQPELGQVEKRNASPDRAHNETWDSIVITGVSGLLVYLAIFGSVFYYGLKYLGLITGKRNKLSFFVCLVGGGVIGTVALIVLKGIEYLGVGLPFGMFIGVVIYVVINALLSYSHTVQIEPSNPYSPLLIVLFSAIAGHFIEINFGIAIVATRTLFWTYAALLLVVGFVIPKMTPTEVIAVQAESKDEGKPSQTSRKRDKISSIRARRMVSRNKHTIFGGLPDWLRNSLVGAVILGIIMATLGYDYLTNFSHTNSFFTILINSLTSLPYKDNALSFGVLGLILITWIVGTLLFAVENQEQAENHNWTYRLGFMGFISFAIGGAFWILQSIGLVNLVTFSVVSQSDLLTQVNNIGFLLTKYYIYLFLVIIFIAFLLPYAWPSRGISKSSLSVILAPVALITIFTIADLSNLRVIDADITFKMAEPFTKNSQWNIATLLYQRSLQLTPQEDHYYLYLGRSYLEEAKITGSTIDQDSLVQKAEKDLKVAQAINPLNTDHTANLARLYSWWASKASTQGDLTERAQKASDYYSAALTLSPNNSTLWDEWASLDMQLLNDPQLALERLNHAMQLDQTYSFTQGLMGDYYLKIANLASDATSKEQALMTAASYYRAAADLAKPADPSSKASYLVSLGNVFTISAGVDPENINREQLGQAIGALQEAITAGLGTADLWKVQQAISKIYLQIGDKSNALTYAEQALQSAPESAISQIQDLITQTQSLP